MIINCQIKPLLFFQIGPRRLFNAFLCILALFLSSCSSKPKHLLKVEATPIPHAQMLEFIKPDLQTQGIDLHIIITEDYNQPNAALNKGEIDANFFQHLQFLSEQIAEFHYQITSIASIEIEPMGIYSKTLRSLSELQGEGVIAIPSDPVNEARALNLLQDNGIIQLDTSNALQASVLNITQNPKQLKFVEMDPSTLISSLSSVDAAVINTNYALEAGLDPTRDALALESKNSPYINVLVVRIEDENNPDILALKAAMTSEKMREFILKTYHGAVIPAF